MEYHHHTSDGTPTAGLGLVSPPRDRSRRIQMVTERDGHVEV